jgi:hypothetical protein
MSPENLSRRAILAGAASVPALALPAVVATAIPAVATPAEAIVDLPALVSTTDPKLLALGEQLKPVVAEADGLNPKRLYQACMDAGGYATLGTNRTDEQQAAAESRFNAAADKNGYHDAYEKWNAACEVKHKLARAILRMSSNDPIGDGIRAAATIVEGSGLDATRVELLHEMAARAGFSPPSYMAKGLKRKGGAIASAKNPDAKVVRARAQMAEADKAIDELLKQPQYLHIDCEHIPGFVDADRRRDKALVDLAKSPARSFEGLIAKAEALTDRGLFRD